VISKRMRYAGLVAHMEDRRGAYMGEPEGKRPLGTPRCIWKGNIKMYLQEIE
jgi:hypothetical protein